MTAGSSARMPLIAGNWKMHNTHFEGLALVQKLAFTLTAADYEAADVVVLPPFTALRSVQTLVAGDKLRIGYGAQDLSPHDKGAYTGDISGPMLAKLSSATPSASWTGPWPASQPSRWRGWWWRTSPSGPSAPEKWRHLRTRRRCARRFVAVFPRVTAPKRPQVCVSCMAGR